MKITEQAADELKKVMVSFGTENPGIKVFSAPGCCGPSIQMEVAAQPESNQTVINIDNINFYIDTDLIDTLEPVTIAYENEGFKLENLPAQSGNCCG